MTVDKQISHPKETVPAPNNTAPKTNGGVVAPTSSGNLAAYIKAAGKTSRPIDAHIGQVIEFMPEVGTLVDQAIAEISDVNMLIDEAVADISSTGIIGELPTDTVDVSMGGVENSKVDTATATTSMADVSTKTVDVSMAKKEIKTSVSAPGSIQANDGNSLPAATSLDGNPVKTVDVPMPGKEGGKSSTAARFPMDFDGIVKQVIRRPTKPFKEVYHIGFIVVIYKKLGDILEVVVDPSQWPERVDKTAKYVSSPQFSSFERTGEYVLTYI